MGRPPSTGGPVFRFTQAEVAEMEACLQQFSNSLPARETISSLAEKFSASQDRAGKIVVQAKQVWNWFQNRRYSQRSRVVKAPAKLPLSSAPREDPSSYRNVTNSVSVAPGKTPPDTMQLEFEAKSARDGAWYDVNSFLSLRKLETGDPEVRVRFAGFGMEEDEWVNVRKYVRQRSLPCEPSECAVVLPGDLILCFQEGKDQALYFDAHVLDAQRRRHDVRGCRCRFLVRYDHDQSEEIVPLKKICRRPETDYRMQILVASKAIVPPVDVTTNNDSSATGGSTDLNMAAQKPRKARKLMDINHDEPSQMKEPELEAGAPSAEGNSSAIPDASTVGATLASASCEKPQQ